MKIFGDRLRELRKEHNESARKLGKIIGISDATLIRWENGDFSPKIEYLVLIAKHYKVTTDYLLGLTDY